MATPDRTPVGVIAGAHGIKGQVKVDLLTDFPQRFAKGARFFLNGAWVEVQAVMWHKDRPILTLDGVVDRNQADALRGKTLEAHADDEPDLEDGEYFAEDLLGLKVVTATGEVLGTVDEVVDYPAHDVLEVGEISIPMVSQFVKDVDLENGVIEVELIYGMRPGEDA